MITRVDLVAALGEYAEKAGIDQAARRVLNYAVAGCVNYGLVDDSAPWNVNCNYWVRYLEGREKVKPTPLPTTAKYR